MRISDWSSDVCSSDLLKLILTLGVMITLGPLTIDMYLPALPDIEVDLATTEAAVQLTLTGTLIGLALGQLVVGPLSDAFGRRMPLVRGTLLHVLTSLLCLFAPSIGRSEERRVGKECGSTCRFRWST